MKHKSQESLDRRGFLGQLGAVALWPAAGAAQAAVGAPPTVPEGQLIERTLGATGLRLPIVSMGVMNASLHTLVARSYERGIRHFDTAWGYQRGLNEAMVGDVVQQLGCRDKVVVSTKIDPKQLGRDPKSPDVKALFLERFAQSLERLKTEYVDILYFHGAWDLDDVHNRYVMEAFEELKAAKKVRFRGVSLHGDQAAILEDLPRSRFWDVALVIFNATMGDDARLVGALEAAAAGGIGLVAMKTQCGGGGQWAQTPGTQGKVPAVPVAGAARAGLNHSALLKWVLRHPFITTAIPGYTTFEQMEQNVSVARNLDLTPDETEFLAKEKARLVSTFCIQCGRCRPQCPRGVDVPTLMRTHMYAYGYRNLELALATHAAVPAAEGPDTCVTCPACSVHCPRRVDVPGRMAALRAIAPAYA